MLRLVPILVVLVVAARAGVVVDQKVFGDSLGGWKADSGKAADYEISGSRYRTYKPEVTPTPNGGIFVSVRIDHRRGWMASADTASLEVSFAPDAALESAQAALAFQGQRITSEVIRGSAKAGGTIAGPAVDQAVRVGTDLVADLSAKLLREKIVEPGRVTFPAAIRHNFNLLFAAVRYEPAGETTEPPPGTDAESVNPPVDKPEVSEKPKPDAKLEIKPFGQPGTGKK